jgi:hypothetical protein
MKWKRGCAYMQLEPTNSLVEDDILEDDIDRLFKQLQYIEPPPSLVPRVLGQLPLHITSAALVSQPVAWNNLDHWVAQNKKRQLC